MSNNGRDELYAASSANHAPPTIKAFAERMSKVQGCRVTLSRERSGYHLYMPCPECLKLHGRKELADPKYAINVSQYLGIGDEFKQQQMAGFGQEAVEALLRQRDKADMGSSLCMRTRSDKHPHRFAVSDLLNMTTVTERHPDILTKANVVGQTGSAEKREHWEIDEASGKLCPPPPGKVVPITSLPPDHPAVVYLTDRGYDLQKLWDQFRCSFCVEEYKEGENGIYYRRMPGFWKDTPQHRIIFYSMIGGIPMTWQARYPEKVIGNERYMLHPYVTNGAGRGLADNGFLWSNTHVRGGAGSAWVPVSPFDEVDAEGTPKFQPSKYRTAKYSERELMGWDAAVKRAMDDEAIVKWCVLCEGPLDAARVGPGGIALIGSSISPGNAQRVASTFNVVFTAFDEDRAGKGATEKVSKMLWANQARNPNMQLVVPLPVQGGKDIGDMTQQAFDALLQRGLKKVARLT